MHGAAKQFGAAANEAAIFIAPLDKLRVARRLFFDLLACHKSSLVHRVQSPPHVSLLIRLRVVAGTATQRHPYALSMTEIPVTALAAAIHEAGSFQVRNQLAHLARHFSIKLVSQPFTGVKAG